MTQAQKIIKYFALALAFLIIVSLISGIFYGMRIFSNIFTDDKIGEPRYFEFKDVNIDILNIDLSATSLVIKNGDYFKVETNNKYVECNQIDNKLTVKETKNNWFSKNGKSEVIIYITESLKEIDMQTGAGNIEIDKLETNDLDFEIGAGKVDIKNLIVFNKANIDGGAGEVIIEDGLINNLDLDMGVGKVSLTSKLTGFSDIDAGVGELNINLLDKLENYKIKVEKGIGTVKINNDSVKNGIYGEGTNSIEIDGGVGSINIKSL